MYSATKGRLVRRLQEARRRARKREVSATLTRGQWYSVMEAAGGCCVYCGAGADTIDHVVPLVQGGGHELGNVVPACRSCNSSKNHHPLAVWGPGKGVDPCGNPQDRGCAARLAPAAESHEHRHEERCDEHEARAIRQQHGEGKADEHRQEHERADALHGMSGAPDEACEAACRVPVHDGNSTPAEEGGLEAAGEHHAADLGP